MLNPLLLRITGEPLLQEIITNHELQCENAACLMFFRQQGLLAVILTDIQYVVFIGAAFIPINNPGPVFLPPPVNVTPQ